MTGIPSELLLAVFGCSGLWALIQMWVQHRWEKKKSADDSITLIKEMCVATTRDRIMHLGKAYLRQGFVHSDELENLIDMYKPYHAAGGNDVASKVIEDVKRLPIKDN